MSTIKKIPAHIFKIPKLAAEKLYQVRSQLAPLIAEGVYGMANASVCTSYPYTSVLCRLI